MIGLEKWAWIGAGHEVTSDGSGVLLVRRWGLVCATPLYIRLSSWHPFHDRVGWIGHLLGTQTRTCSIVPALGR